MGVQESRGLPSWSLLETPRSILPDLFSDLFFLPGDSGRHRNLLKSVSIDRYRAAFFRFLASLNFHFPPIFLPPVIPVVVYVSSLLSLPPRKTTNRSFRHLTSYSVNASIDSPWVIYMLEMRGKWRRAQKYLEEMAILSCMNSITFENISEKCVYCDINFKIRNIHASAILSSSISLAHQSYMFISYFALFTSNCLIII